MPRYYLVRHGQTEWNATGMYQGQMDVPLNQTGRQQALALQGRLAGVTFAAVYTSTLSRARETAALLIAPHAETATTLNNMAPGLAAFDEISYGSWEGQTIDRIRTLYAEDWQHYRANPVTGCPPGGETRGQLRARVVAALDEIARAHAPQSQILLVTHGGAMRAIITQLLGLDVGAYIRLHFDNASLSIVNLPVPAPTACPADLHGILVLLNDTAHLEPLKAYPDYHATPR